ncbi:hypothetical protein [Longimicrobium sp.]|jgi:hypothetical protein|uniref:hypothetical protein n=1 Tax=Longimicrobium sp. TaxID=2029185 RepID=UPI002F91D2AB
MGWLQKLIGKVGGAQPTDWTLLDGLPDPGLGIAGKPIVPDQCYIELYVESLRLEKARRFATTFHGLIYSFASLARQGTDRAELASVTKPQNLATLGVNDLNRVITVSKRVMRPMPWRGNPLGLELGLFSIKSGNLLSPLVNYITKVSDLAGISVVTRLNPFVPLVLEGLDMIAGQTADSEIELAIDTDMSLVDSRLCALVARPKGTISGASLKIDPQDRKLLVDGKPLQAAYCVFSIRSSSMNPEWGEIPALKEAYADFTRAIMTGKHKEAEEALAAFNRQLIVSPDLISADKDRLKEKVKADLRDAFPGGGQSAPDGVRARFENRKLADLNLYDQ